MKKLLLCLFLGCCYPPKVSAQLPKAELYDLVVKLMYDSTGNENVGDWAVGTPKKYPVKWKADRIEMSDDTSINFCRTGAADVTIKGKNFWQAGVPVKWNIMLKGARMGYSSLSIFSSASQDLRPRHTLDSLFGKKNF